MTLRTYIIWFWIDNLIWDSIILCDEDLSLKFSKKEKKRTRPKYMYCVCVCVCVKGDISLVFK